MSKELEALECLERLEYYHIRSVNDLGCKEHRLKDINTIKQALQRLSAIDNANPSEAIKCLEHIKKYYIPEPCSAKTYDCLETIKQALIKAQENARSEEILQKYYQEGITLDSVRELKKENELLKEQNVKYKNLEEKLGCSLEIAFKALENGIYTKESELDKELEWFEVRGIEQKGVSVISKFCSYAECDFTCYYKDYKKTWWLKEDKSE